jgi:hypothetical protein
MYEIYLAHTLRSLTYPRIHLTFRTPYFESQQNTETSDKIIACFYVKITVVFWVVVLCSLAEGYQCFGRTCWLHLKDTRVSSQPKDGGSKFLLNTGNYQTMQHHLPQGSNLHVLHEKFKFHTLYIHHRYQKINSPLCWM